MNGHYTIPAAIALSLHAVVLFGFRGHAPAVATPKAISPAEDPWPVVQVIDYAPVLEDADDDRADQPQRGHLDAFSPGLPELPRDPGPRDFVIATTPTPPQPIATDHIRHGPFGVPDGALDGLAAPGSVLDAKMLDDSPRTRNQVSPLYPAEARMRGTEGRVLVGFIVDEGGRVLSPHALECTDRIFEDAAVRAVAKWSFEPGRSHGRIVRFKMAVPIVFRMNE